MLNRPFIWAFCLSLFAIVNLTGVPLAGFQTDNEFVVGEATAQGVSISERISAAYTLILIGLALLFAGFMLFRKFNSVLEKHPLVGLLDQLVHFSILLLCLSFFHPPLLESAQLVLFMLLLALLSGAKRFFKADFSDERFWLVTGVIFIANYLLFHSAVTGALSSIIFFALTRRIGLHRRATKFTALLLASLPIIAFLSIESTVILNQRGVFLQSYWPLTACVILVFILLGYLSVRKSEDWNNRFVFHQLLPIALVSIGVVQCYAPVIVQPNEMFEAANQLNPVMQSALFGETPLIDNLSSHLVSDFFWVFLYGKLNGYHGDASMLMYADFNYILALLSVYIFINRVSSHSSAAIACLLLLPCVYFILPFYYAYALIPIAFFYSFVKENNRKALLSFFFSTCILAFWRLDIAVSLISALVIFVPIWYYLNPIHRKPLLRWSLIFGASGAAIAIVFALSHPLAFQQAAAYFGANQAHGLSQLTNHTSNTFYLSYYLLPLLISAILVHTLLYLFKHPGNALSAVILLLGLFYIFNLQRGLVRHSFIEFNDTQINSFAWLVIVLKSFALVKNENKKRAISIALTSCSLLALFFSVQLDNGRINAMLRGTRLSLKDLPQLKAEPINRVLPNPEFQQTHAALILFLRQNLKKEETFIDFSNNALLYFYAGKNVPSYFNQYLQNTVSGKLQRINLSTLRRTKAPLVVFSQTPETVLDYTDNIPNKVRYFELTNYIYANYEPWGKIGAYRLWKRKGTLLHPPAEAYPVHPENWNLGLLPYFWKANKNEQFVPSEKAVTFSRTENNIQWSKQLLGLEFLELTITSSNNQFANVFATNINIRFALKKGVHRYKIPLGCSENLNLENMKSLQFSTDSEGSITNVRILKLQHR